MKTPTESPEIIDIISIILWLVNKLDKNIFTMYHVIPPNIIMIIKISKS